MENKQENNQQNASKSENSKTQQNQKAEERPQETSGTLEEAFKAATHGTDSAHDKPYGHPTEVFHAREETGRKAEEDKTRH